MADDCDEYILMKNRLSDIYFQEGDGLLILSNAVSVLRGEGDLYHICSFIY